MRLLNCSEKGLRFENTFVTRFIKAHGGRAATTQEQQEEQIDYIFDDGTKMDVKHQPQAYSYGTVNVEIYEYNTYNPKIRNDSWWRTSTAELYFWYVGNNEMYIVSKDKLKPYVEGLLNPHTYMQQAAEAKLFGARISKSNSKGARHVSSQWGSSKLDNAFTILIPISLLNKIKEAKIIVDDRGYYTL